MSTSRIIVLATPVFFALIAQEFLIGRARGRDTYRLHDAMASIGLGMTSQVVGVFTKLFGFALYAWVYEHAALARLEAGAWWVWLGALVFYDFCYYWLHRAGHRVGVLWAAHAVHHQSEDYNLSTALRQTSSGWLFGWIFYLPMALAGVPPLVFSSVALVDLLYQYWVHTQQIGRLGWFDRWFCSPSNHRVHHAVNDRYLDRNYGGILIIWDRLFGSFVEEDQGEPIVYGTRAPLRSFDPLWANLQVYRELVLDSWRAKRWRDKLRVWLAPPGWRPADVAARWPKPAFDLHRWQRFDPRPGRGERLAAIGLFVAALALSCVFLWSSAGWGLAAQVGNGLAIVGLLMLVARLSHGTARSQDRAEAPHLTGREL